MKTSVTPLAKYDLAVICTPDGKALVELRKQKESARENSTQAVLTDAAV
jgi:hypothetical protein